MVTGIAASAAPTRCRRFTTSLNGRHACTRVNWPRSRTSSRTTTARRPQCRPQRASSAAPDDRRAPSARGIPAHTLSGPILIGGRVARSVAVTRTVSWWRASVRTPSRRRSPHCDRAGVCWCCCRRAMLAWPVALAGDFGAWRTVLHGGARRVDLVCVDGIDGVEAVVFRHRRTRTAGRRGGGVSGGRALPAMASGLRNPERGADHGAAAQAVDEHERVQQRRTSRTARQTTGPARYSCPDPAPHRASARCRCSSESACPRVNSPCRWRDRRAPAAR